MGLILGSGRSLKEEIATYSSILAWRIPWTEEPGVRREAQGAFHVAPGKSGLHAHGKGERVIALEIWYGNRASRHVKAGLSRSFSGGGGKPSCPSPSAGDLRVKRGSITLCVYTAAPGSGPSWPWESHISVGLRGQADHSGWGFWWDLRARKGDHDIPEGRNCITQHSTCPLQPGVLAQPPRTSSLQH